MPGPLAALAPSRARPSSSSPAVRFAATTSATGAGSLRRSAWRSSSSTQFARALRAVSSIAARSASTPSTGSKPELRRRDRQHARAAAEVGRTTGEPRSTSRAAGSPPAAAPGTSGWSDACRCRTPRPGSITTSSTPPRCGRLLPRRAHVQPPGDQHREVEALPALVPVVGDLLGDAPRRARRRRRASKRAEVGQLARRAVDRVLDDARPARRARPPPRRRPARAPAARPAPPRPARARQRTREPDQPRKACRMRSNRPVVLLRAG